MNAIDINTLPKTIDELHSFIVTYAMEKENEIASLRETYEIKLQYFSEQLRIMQAKLFGRTSEKIPEAALGQGTLFDEAEYIVDQSGGISAEEKEQIVVKTHSRARNNVGRNPLPADLPRTDYVVPLTEEQQQLLDTNKIKCIGDERSEKLNYEPAKLSVTVIIRRKFVRIDDGKNYIDDTQKEIIIAPKPDELIPKSIATPSLMAHIIASKFCDALPLHRLEKIFKRLKIHISRQIMSFWLMCVYEKIKVLRDIILEHIRGGPVIGIDETRVQVLKEPGRADTSESYMWCARSSYEGRTIVHYTYATGRGSDVARSILGDFNGIVQCDGFKAYDFLERTSSITRAGCWAHVRRKFVEANEAAQGKSELAQHMIKLIGELYGIEQEAIERNYNSDQLLTFREEYSLPILDTIHEWLTTHAATVVPTLALGKAIGYALNEWHTLTVYVHNGHMRIDNNLVENAIRPFVIGRKNWLFCGSPRGANASALFYSLIETAKANGWEPLDYMLRLVNGSMTAKTRADFEALLPYIMKP